MKKRIFSLLLALSLLAGLVPVLAQPASAAVTRYWPVVDHTHVGWGYCPPDHYGIDINGAGVEGKTVINVVGGTVCAIYQCPRNHLGNLSASCCYGFGTGVVIAGEDGYYYQYAHMQENSMPGYVYYGAAIPAGWEIGKVGNTGNSSGPHLHYQVATSRSDMNANSISPWSFTYTYSTPTNQPTPEYVNLGNDFYAHIKFPATGHGVCNVNGNVQLGTYNTTSSLWRFVRQSNGSYKIISAVDGNVLDVANGNTANETNLWTYPSNDTIAQRFYIQASGSRYNIVAANCGKVMDVKHGASSTAGTNVHIYSSNGSADQQFEIVYTSWLQRDGKWYYYANGAKATGWTLISGKWYYFNGQGVMQTGWVQIGSKWYFFNTSGAMVTGWKQTGNTWYYLQSNGAMKTGWLQLGSTWYCFNTDGVMITGTVTVNGKQHRFANDGKWLGEVTAHRGWVKENGNWYYYDQNGKMAIGWRQIGGKWYAFKSDGAMITGWASDGGKRYYMGSDGAMVTGWKQIGGYWYYFQSGGAMYTGWKQEGSHWYYFNTNGIMHKGWLQLGNKRYAFNDQGHMITGWGRDGNHYYYFGSDGVMVTGQKYIDGKWYYFGSDGKLLN